MRGSTLPGTVQLRATTDRDDAEDFSRKLSGFLRSNGMSVVSASTDFQDKADPDRVIFHMVAVPKRAKVMVHTQEVTDEQST